MSPPTADRLGRRRFTWAVTTGAVVAAVPYVWVLFVDWGKRPNLLRTVYGTVFTANFYDLQARAIMAGHLYVPRAPLQREAWIHDGHAYTYFGVFPSLLRIPVLLVTHRFDGRLTALSLLLSWVLTAVFISMLFWRVRIMVRGSVQLGRAEATVFGVLVASVLSGSVLIYLGSNPYVYSEDAAGVALSVGAFLALLGVLERPSWRGVIISALFIAACNLTRLTDGYACVLGAVLVAGWFAIGRAGEENRRWWLPVLGVAVVAVAAGCAVNWLKFGTFFGLPLNDYVAYQIHHQSRINGGRYFDFVYLPTTLWVYFAPRGVRFTHIFPWVALPYLPVKPFGGVKFDFIFPSSGVTATMPLLLALSLVGIVSAFRRRAGQVAGAFRLLLIAAGVGTAGVLLFGSLSNRYLADFLLLLVLGSAIGTVFLWERAERRSRRVRVAVVAIVIALGTYGMVVNVGLAVAPKTSWSSVQRNDYHRFERSVQRLTSGF